MRLDDRQLEIVRAEVQRTFGPQSRLWLFGSRTIDQRRGGDVDLYVEPVTRCPLREELRCKVALQEKLGLPVDLVVNHGEGSQPIFRLARQQGVEL